MLPTLEVQYKTETEQQEPNAAHVVSYLAHELREPLSTLESLAYYLEIILPPVEIKARQQIDKIQSLVQQANGILNDAVHFAQASTSRPSVVAIDQLITQTVADRDRSKGLNLHLEIPPEPCQVRLDPSQAQHLICSVLNLFRHVAQPGTPVHIVTANVRDQVELRVSCVSDSVRPAQFQRMFQPFNRELPAGTGLSLASVQRIIDVHQGELEVNAGSDQRLALCIRFPVAR